MLIGFIVLIICIGVVLSRFGKNACYISKDYEVNDHKCCPGDFCKDRETYMNYQNYLKDE